MSVVFVLIVSVQFLNATFTSHSLEHDVFARWLNKIQGFTRCLQVIDVSFGGTEPVFPADFLLDNIQYSYVVRDYIDLLNQDIYKFEAKIKNNTLRQKDNDFIYKVCSRIILLAERTQSVLMFFNDSRNGSKRFYPLTEIVLVTPMEPKLSINHYNYININALHVFWLESNYFNRNDSVALYSIKNCLTNISIPFPFVHVRSDVKQFMSDYDVHPLLSSNARPFRASFFSCSPYVMYDKTEQRYISFYIIVDITSK